MSRERRRTRGRGDRIHQLAESYMEKRNAFRKAIKIEKDRCWRKLQDDLKRDIWGEAYKIMINSLNLRIPKEHMPQQRKVEIARELFPLKPVMEWVSLQEQVEAHILPVSEAEMANAATRMKNRTAPGVDEIPPEAVKVWAKEAPKSLTDLLNKYFVRQIFPDEWKTSRLVLIPKPGRNLEASSGYRPLCLLNTLAKLYESVILARLEGEIEAKGGLSLQQYGFTKGRSTVGAIERVLETAADARRGNKLCALVLVDIKNAFNTASWPRIMYRLVQKKIQPHVVNLMGSYLKHRSVQVTSRKCIQVTGAVPQGSVLGPCLWNILYDDVLRLNIPQDSLLVAYADDLAAVVVGKDEKELMDNGNDILRKILQWIDLNELEIAPEKSEAVLLVGMRRPKNVSFKLGSTTIEPQKVVKYLGVLIDKGLTFGPHVQKICEKAEKIVSALIRIMPNIGGAGQRKKIALAEAVHAVLLYAAPVWAKAVNIERHKQRLRSTQRKRAIRVASLYRTTSTEAAQVIASIIPIEELVRERADVMQRDEPRRRGVN